MEGADNLAENLLIGSRADLSRWTGCRPPYFYFLIGNTTRAVYMTAHDNQWVLNAEDLSASRNPIDAVRAAIHADVAVEILGQPSASTSGAQVADHFRVGPVFLAGDAAHRLTPAGGMGMNTGIHDVHNLAVEACGCHCWLGRRRFTRHARVGTPPDRCTRSTWKPCSALWINTAHGRRSAIDLFKRT